MDWLGRKNYMLQSSSVANQIDVLPPTKTAASLSTFDGCHRMEGGPAGTEAGMLRPPEYPLSPQPFAFEANLSSLIASIGSAPSSPAAVSGVVGPLGASDAPMDLLPDPGIEDIYFDYNDAHSRKETGLRSSVTTASGIRVERPTMDSYKPINSSSVTDQGKHYAPVSQRALPNSPSSKYNSASAYGAVKSASPNRIADTGGAVKGYSVGVSTGTRIQKQGPSGTLARVDQPAATSMPKTTEALSSEILYNKRCEVEDMAASVPATNDRQVVAPAEAFDAQSINLDRSTLDGPRKAEKRDLSDQDKENIVHLESTKRGRSEPLMVPGDDTTAWTQSISVASALPSRHTTISSNDICSAATGPSKVAPKAVRRLGGWFFDKKKRRRVYISLTGAKFEGRDGILAQREDELLYPSRGGSAGPASSRAELCNMASGVSHNVEDLIAKSGSIELSLLDWGVPRAVVARYLSTAKVSTLFGWQSECLLSESGAVLRGERNLVYSAPTSGGKTLVAELLMLHALARAQRRHLEACSGSPNAGGGERSQANKTPPLQHPQQQQQQLLRGFGTILFVVPFVALAEEKTKYFQSVWRDMRIGVCSFTGDDSGDMNTLSADVELAICTIEKANIVTNQLIEEGREDQLLMVVVDELHLVGDSKRGYLLEVLLSKVMFVWGQRVQIVGMSATLPNLSDIAAWLRASLYVTSFRPLPLAVRVCMDRKLYEYSSRSASASNGGDAVLRYLRDVRLNWTSSTTASTVGDASVTVTAKTSEQSHPPAIADSDGLVALCCETVLTDGKSVIVFIPTKKWCETASVLIADAFQRIRESDDKAMRSFIHEAFGHRAGGDSSAPTSCRTPYVPPELALHGRSYSADACVQSISAEAERVNRCRRLMLTLADCSVGACHTLQRTVLQSVAYHHAGLTRDERTAIESAFRSGTIRVLCATSTLAAGVNLPAHRVIIRSPKTAGYSANSSLPTTSTSSCPQMPSNMLSVSTFRQMCGRAGRMNLDAEGEAILMLQNTSLERSMGNALVNANSIEPIRSALKDASGGGIEKFILEMINAGKISTFNEIRDYVSLTLLRVQEPSHHVDRCMQQAMKMLVEFGFIIGVETAGAAAPSHNTPAAADTSSTPTRRRSLRRLCAVSAAVISDDTTAVTHAAASPVDSAKRAGPSAVLSGATGTNESNISNNNFIEPVQSFRFYASPLGRATALSGIAPRDATIVIKHLQLARNRLILKSGLHCVFLVTPPFASGLEPPWDKLEPLFSYVIREYPDTRAVFELLQVDWAELIRLGRCPPKPLGSTSANTSATGDGGSGHGASAPATHSTERIILYRRLYAAVLLFVLTQEVPLGRVADFVHAPRGQVQQLQKEAAAFCGMATTFCRKLHWDALASVLESYSGRLGYGACEEILPLVRLGSSIMPPFRARALYRSGVRCPEDIVGLPMERLVDLLMASLPFDSKAPVNAAASKPVPPAVRSTSSCDSSAAASTRIVNEDKLHLCSRLASQIVKRSREVIRERIMLQSFQ